MATSKADMDGKHERALEKDAETRQKCHGTGEMQAEVIKVWTERYCVFTALSALTSRKTPCAFGSSNGGIYLRTSSNSHTANKDQGVRSSIKSSVINSLTDVLVN